MAETTTTVSRPSPYVEAFGKSLTEQVLKQIEKPVDTSKFAPQVVDVDPFTPVSGVTRNKRLVPLIVASS